MIKYFISVLFTQSFLSKLNAALNSIMGPNSKLKFIKSNHIHFIESHAHETIKMVLVVRTDLGMQKGKIASQCAHAAINCYKNALQRSPDVLKQWETGNGQAKIVLQTENQDSLFELHASATSLGLISQIIYDAGRTQIPYGSATVLGIGPGPGSLINKVTGKLKLY